MNPIATLVSDILADIEGKMTDVVCLVIQNDHDLMHRYLGLIRNHGVDAVNQGIGQAVKVQLKHSTVLGRNEKPRSTLIQSHEIHTP